MQRYRLCAVIALAVIIFGSNLQADVINTTGGGLTFPDDDAGGVTSTLSIAVDETISDVQVDLFSLSHTWVGDLIGRISSPAGTTADLFFRVGNGNFGDGSNLSGNYSFADGGANWASAAGSVGGNANVPNGIYQPSTDGDGPISLATAFSGESTQGTWTLFISDNAQFDTGSLGSWGLAITSTVTAMPEPGPGLLFLMTACVFSEQKTHSLSNSQKNANRHRRDLRGGERNHVSRKR